MPEVVVPWAPGCPHREKAWAWLRSRYEAEGWKVHEGTVEGPWRKARAVADAISRCTDDVLVVADADVWTDGLADAVAALEAGAAWVVPHHTVHRLDQRSSDRFMAGQPGPFTYSERPYKGRAAGGIVVLTRDLWEQVPIDPRFVGWGGEDDAWNLALSSEVGKGHRLDADLWHLWHPPQPRLSRGVGSEASRDLYRRYLRASKRPDEMAVLLDEVRREMTP